MKEIPLTKGFVALVDDADFESVSAFKWHVNKQGSKFYAARKIKKDDGSQTALLMHRFLMPGVSAIDHKDGASLNNQRANLRPATSAQNSQGFRKKRPGASSIYRGVSWETRGSKWRANIRVNTKHLFLGYFDSEKNAARAYDAASRKYFGSFASPNFV